ncbi:hypothetical protein PYCC9005_003292 [Savitreella phatthalungensis]
MSAIAFPLLALALGSLKINKQQQQQQPQQQLKFVVGEAPQVPLTLAIVGRLAFAKATFNAKIAALEAAMIDDDADFSRLSAGEMCSPPSFTAWSPIVQQTATILGEIFEDEIDLDDADCDVSFLDLNGFASSAPTSASPTLSDCEWFKCPSSPSTCFFDSAYGSDTEGAFDESSKDELISYKDFVSGITCENVDLPESTLICEGEQLENVEAFTSFDRDLESELGKLVEDLDEPMKDNLIADTAIVADTTVCKPSDLEIPAPINDANALFALLDHEAPNEPKSADPISPAVVVQQCYPVIHEGPGPNDLYSNSARVSAGLETEDKPVDYKSPYAISYSLVNRNESRLRVTVLGQRFSNNDRYNMTVIETADIRCRALPKLMRTLVGSKSAVQINTTVIDITRAVSDVAYRRKLGQEHIAA